MDHRELEVRGRIVDRDARVLGEQHHRERDGGECEARIDRRGLRCARRLDDRRQRRRSPRSAMRRRCTISSAGSARKPTIISRRAPSVPNAVPMSIAASDEEHARQSRTGPPARSRPPRRRAASRCPSTERSPPRSAIAAEDDVRRDAKQRRRVLGDRPRPCGRACECRDRAASRLGALRFCSQARHWLTQPTKSGAAASAATHLEQLRDEVHGRS